MPRKTVGAGEQEKIMEKGRADRRKELKAVENFGVEPLQGSECFTAFGRDLFDIPPEYMIGLKSPTMNCSLSENVDWAERCAFATSEEERMREVLYCNAGAPMKQNANQGKQFVGTYPLVQNEQGQKVRSDTAVDWAFEITPAERCGVTYANPSTTTVNKATGLTTVVEEPTKIPTLEDATVDKATRYSKADTLARYVVGDFLKSGSVYPLKHVIFGVEVDYKTGRSLQMQEPVRDELDSEEAYDAKQKHYAHQRSRVRRAISKVYLVYPVAIDHIFNTKGGVYAQGELELASKESREPNVLQSFAPQPVVFLTMTPDRISPHAVAPSVGVINGGLHDMMKAFVLVPHAVEELKKLLSFYKLEADFPALANLDPVRNSSMLDFDALRSEAIAQIGPPPGADHEPLDREWLDKRRKAPFSKVWINRASDGRLVPLLKGRAEEKNGTVWLYSDALEEDRSPEGAAHYIAVKTALKRISGKNWDVAGVKRGSTNFNVLLDQREGDDKGKRRKNSTALIEFDDSSVKIAEERDALKAKCDALEENNSKNRYLTNPKRSSGRLTIPDNSTSLAVRINRPLDGSTYLVIGKRGELGYKKIEVDATLKLSLLFCNDPESSSSSD